MAERDDAALLRDHIDGDAEAFGLLVARHRDRLWAVAVRTIGDRDEAADALQDALLSAFRKAETFRGDAQVSTWLHRIVVNACLDRVRRAKTHRTEPLPDDEDRLGALADRQGAVDPAVASERRTDVMAALAELTVEQRTSLVLVDMEGYSVEEVAELMRCPTGTVKSRCARGRARLAPLLAQYRGQPTGNPDQPEDVQPDAERRARLPGTPQSPQPHERHQ